MWFVVALFEREVYDESQIYLPFFSPQYLFSRSFCPSPDFRNKFLDISKENVMVLNDYVDSQSSSIINRGVPRFILPKRYSFPECVPCPANGDCQWQVRKGASPNMLKEINKLRAAVSDYAYFSNENVINKSIINRLFTSVDTYLVCHTNFALRHHVLSYSYLRTLISPTHYNFFPLSQPSSSFSSFSSSFRFSSSSTSAYCYSNSKLIRAEQNLKEKVTKIIKQTVFQRTLDCVCSNKGICYNSVRSEDMKAIVFNNLKKDLFKMQKQFYGQFDFSSITAQSFLNLYSKCEEHVKASTERFLIDEWDGERILSMIIRDSDLPYFCRLRRFFENHKFILIIVLLLLVVVIGFCVRIYLLQKGKRIMEDIYNCAKDRLKVKSNSRIPIYELREFVFESLQLEKNLKPNSPKTYHEKVWDDVLLAFKSDNQILQSVDENNFECMQYVLAQS
jgi:hypothetical protein